MSVLISNLQAFIGAEGPVILLTWTNPDSADAIRVMRRKLSYPEGPLDGVQVIELTSYVADNEIGIIDEGVVDGGVDTYYYNVFSRVGSDWYSDPTTKIIITTIQTVTFDPQLIKRLPEIFGVVAQ